MPHFPESFRNWWSGFHLFNQRSSRSDSRPDSSQRKRDTSVSNVAKNAMQLDSKSAAKTPRTLSKKKCERLDKSQAIKNETFVRIDEASLKQWEQEAHENFLKHANLSKKPINLEYISEKTQNKAPDLVEKAIIQDISNASHIKDIKQRNEILIKLLKERKIEWKNIPRIIQKQFKFTDDPDLNEVNAKEEHTPKKVRLGENVQVAERNYGTNRVKVWDPIANQHVIRSKSILYQRKLDAEANARINKRFEELDKSGKTHFDLCMELEEELDLETLTNTFLQEFLRNFEFPMSHIEGHIQSIFESAVNELTEQTSDANISIEEGVTNFQRIFFDELVKSVQLEEIDRDLFRDLAGDRVNDGKKAPVGEFPESLITDYNTGVWGKEEVRTIEYTPVPKFMQPYVEKAVKTILEHPSFAAALKKHLSR